ncbi:hypothetical protein XENORESO_017489 [Xenotaenia resolanae]|uniref:Uncharacterized protein n=1 Tax=Xenotaenia resolanae TaxID=208358 RepID=A0ABV0X606_9TELE
MSSLRGKWNQSNFLFVCTNLENEVDSGSDVQPRDLRRLCDVIILDDLSGSCRENLNEFSVTALTYRAAQSDAVPASSQQHAALSQTSAEPEHFDSVRIIQSRSDLLVRSQHRAGLCSFKPQ